jgi:predicted nucleic acid-binding protein
VLRRKIGEHLVAFRERNERPEQGCGQSGKPPGGIGVLGSGFHRLSGRCGTLDLYNVEIEVATVPASNYAAGGERFRRVPFLPGGSPDRPLEYTLVMAALVYLETSVISYLTAQPSRDVIVAGRQQLTHEWWRRRRSSFEVVVSELVHLECADGDPVAAARRADFLAVLRSLEITPEAEEFALALLRDAALPSRAQADALHIAIAATQGVSYLLTWNSAHIANAEKRPLVEAACRVAGYEAPILCTPDELMGEESHVDAP